MGAVISLPITPFNDKVKEWVELLLKSSSEPSWNVRRWNLNLILHLPQEEMVQNVDVRN